MQHIELVAVSDEVQNYRLQELFESKLSYLSNSLEYLDLVCISATVTITGKERESQLETHVTVSCDDKGFKKVIDGVVNLFNHYVFPLPELASDKRAS